MKFCRKSLTAVPNYSKFIHGSRWIPVFYSQSYGTLKRLNTNQFHGNDFHDSTMDLYVPVRSSCNKFKKGWFTKYVKHSVCWTYDYGYQNAMLVIEVLMKSCVVFRSSAMFLCFSAWWSLLSSEGMSFSGLMMAHSHIVGAAGDIFEHLWHFKKSSEHQIHRPVHTTTTWWTCLTKHCVEQQHPQ